MSRWARIRASVEEQSRGLYRGVLNRAFDDLGLAQQ
jgi:hypothetical protein